MLLLAIAVGMVGIATSSLVWLIDEIRTGVIRGRYGHRTDRSKEPLTFWLSVVLRLVINLIFYYFALMMFIAVLTGG